MTTIQKTPHNTTYKTSLFDLSIPKRKSKRPMICFTNHEMAVAMFIDRSEAADILQRKFKNLLDMNRKTTRFMLK
jgi:lipid A disaccharide synthetase